MVIIHFTNCWHWFFGGETGRKNWNDILIIFLFQGAKQEETAAGSSSGSVTDAKPSGPSTSRASTEKISTDKHRNYAVLAGTVAALGAIGWYLQASKKKPEEVQDWRQSTVVGILAPFRLGISHLSDYRQPPNLIITFCLEFLGLLWLSDDTVFSSLPGIQ